MTMAYHENQMTKEFKMTNAQTPAASGAGLVICTSSFVIRHFVGLALTICCLANSFAAEQPASLKVSPLDVSFRNEIQRAIDKGLAWLQTKQDTNGFWSTADHPAVTALALTAFMGEPGGRYQTNSPEFINKSFDFIAKCAQPDGSIHNKKGLANYNTATSMMALLAANRPEFDPAVRRARAF